VPNAAYQSPTVSFADVAHQTLIFDRRIESNRLILDLIDTRWIQRLRDISQTGNTKLVYMFAEHSRFGHSLGVAYLASLLMKSMREKNYAAVAPYENAVAAAAILHDAGHVAPGSHLAEKIWAPGSAGQHEQVTLRIIKEDEQIREILSSCHPGLLSQVQSILAEDSSVPPWTKSVIGGGGWNADRGNWSMVDSAMCAVSYGRYNVTALIDAFCLSPGGELCLQENRLDALTHFFVARDSMYRQVYQHRVLQAADALTRAVVLRLRDLSEDAVSSGSPQAVQDALAAHGAFADSTMLAVLLSNSYGSELPISSLYEMTESWWTYHLHRWCNAHDQVLADLAQRCRTRRLPKTIRLSAQDEENNNEQTCALIEQVKHIAGELGYPPRYYVATIEEKDKHRQKAETVPLVMLDTGEIVPATAVEPMIDQLMRRPQASRRWLAVPAEVKQKLGRIR